MRAQLAASLVLACRARDGVRDAESALQRIRGAGDRQVGPSQAFIAAIALTWGAADERAIDELVALLAQPLYVSRDWLRIDPRLASLRQLARFRTLVAPVPGAG